MLEAGDVDAYVAHLARHDDESGTDGELPYGPYGRAEREAPEQVREKALRRWATPLDTPDWRRVWALFEDSRVVGSVYLAGGGLPSMLHRADCGIGIERPHRGRGLGRALMNEAIAWARAEPRLSWIDLGVFEGNDRAEKLYLSLGFERVGRTPDLFRVDGRVIDNIQMALSVDG